MRNGENRHLRGMDIFTARDGKVAPKLPLQKADFGRLSCFFAAG
jgi:hypothetical protein